MNIPWFPEAKHKNYTQGATQTVRGERARGPSVTRQPSGDRVRRGFRENTASAVGNHLGLNGRKEGRKIGWQESWAFEAFCNTEKKAPSSH